MSTNYNIPDVLDEYMSETVAKSETKVPPIQVERLEYGKICVEPDGAVMRVGINNMLVEHRALGMSNKFPREIIDICQPNYLDVKNRLGEELPAGCFHGTVLRPSVKNQLIRPIFFRLKQRAEDKELPTSREYTIGRYLTSEREISPQAFLTAMNEVPLYGLTEQEAASYSLTQHEAGLYGLTEEQSAKIDPALISPANFLPSRMAQIFVREAIIFVLSGIPLAFSSYVSENDFFECVTALWLALPPTLRRLLSAGWGVGSTFSGRLTITYSQHQSATCARFSPDMLSWQTPAQVIVGNDGELVAAEFFDARLIPGRAFVSLFYPSGRETLDYSDAKTKGNFLLENKKNPDWFEDMPAVEVLHLQEHKDLSLPEARDLPMLKVFRAPGFKALDEIDYKRLSKWLEGKDSDNSSLNLAGEIKLNAADFHYSHSRQIALDEILDALDEPKTRERGDIALWKSLGNPVSNLFIKIIDENPRKFGRFRAQLILALRQAKLAAFMNGLVNASKAGEADCFPPKLTAFLLKTLTSSVESKDKEVLSLHTRMLGLQDIPPIYRHWLLQHGLRLVMTLAHEFGGISDDINQKIKEIVPDESVQAICSLLQNLEPIDNDKRFIGNLDDAERQDFYNLLFQQWKRIDEETPVRRENLIEWIRLMPPVESGIALLKIIWKELLEQQHCNGLLNEIEEVSLPDSLIKPLTILVLEHWSIFSERIDKNPIKWKQIIDNFPASYQRVLVPAWTVKQNVKADANIQASANTLQLLSIDFKRLIKGHENSPFYQQDAPLLLDLVWRSFKYSATPREVEDLCYCLEERILPETSEPPPIQHIDSCAQLVRYANFAKDLKKEAQKLWNSARQSWHLVFLLAVFPDVRFVPAAEHLTALIPYRRWLSDHLTKSFHRKEAFQLAAQDFHSFNYQKHSNYWRDEFARTGVWAAFEDVPLNILPDGALRKALNLYNQFDGAPTINNIEIQAELSWRFLQPYRRSNAEYRTARRQVAFECLFPLLDRISKDDTKELLTAAEKAVNANWLGWIPGDDNYREYLRSKIPYNNLRHLLKFLAFIPKDSSSSLHKYYKIYRRNFRR